MFFFLLKMMYNITTCFAKGVIIKEEFEMDEKYYKEKIIKMINEIHSLHTLRCIYEFVLNLFIR